MSQHVVVQRFLNDGTGRVCIHLFVRSEQGPIRNPSGEIKTSAGAIAMQGAKGYIACNREQNTVQSQRRGHETLVCVNSDDARAVTCPKCRESAEFREQMEALESLVGSEAAAFAA